MYVCPNGAQKVSPLKWRFFIDFWESQHHTDVPTWRLKKPTGCTPPPLLLQTQNPLKKQKMSKKKKRIGPRGGGRRKGYVGLFRLFDLFEINSKVDFNF